MEEEEEGWTLTIDLPIAGAFKVDHAIQAGKSGPSTVVAMLVQALFGNHIATRLWEELARRGERERTVKGDGEEKRLRAYRKKRRPWRGVSEGAGRGEQKGKRRAQVRRCLCKTAHGITRRVTLRATSGPVGFQFERASSSQASVREEKACSPPKFRLWRTR